jgi:hypothetical protein
LGNRFVVKHRGGETAPPIREGGCRWTGSTWAMFGWCRWWKSHIIQLIFSALQLSELLILIFGSWSFDKAHGYCDYTYSIFGLSEICWGHGISNMEVRCLLFKLDNERRGWYNGLVQRRINLCNLPDLKDRCCHVVWLIPPLITACIAIMILRGACGVIFRTNLSIANNNLAFEP